MIISCSLWYILSLSFTCNFPWCGRFTVLCMSYTGGAAEELGAEEEESGGHIRPEHSASDRHDPSRFGEKHRGSPSGQPESSRSPAASRHLHWRHRSWCGRQIQHAKLYICVFVCGWQIQHVELYTCASVRADSCELYLSDGIIVYMWRVLLLQGKFWVSNPWVCITTAPIPSHPQNCTWSLGLYCSD